MCKITRNTVLAITHFFSNFEFDLTPIKPIDLSVLVLQKA
jgi:hypothetical protein